MFDTSDYPAQNPYNIVQNNRKVKSVNKNVTKSLEFKDYKNTLDNKTTMYSKMYRIRSNKHQLETVLKTIINK